MLKKQGDFTLPGESGCEELTLELAKKWGADVIRDSDGTELSDEIVNAGYGIYSTLCVIRDHNEWAKKHPDCLQQTFLMSNPKIATESEVKIELLDGYFCEQFKINDSEQSQKYWQVFDRTINKEVFDWTYSNGEVTISNAVKWHKYTVNFLAYRIWEEISMYNQVTNDLNKEHLVPIDPMKSEVREYMREWLKDWCAKHPKTTVVRFTSMFYNFVWIWGSNPRKHDVFTDWASYDFTVSPTALERFESEYGYRIKSEDFINKGRLNATHMPCDKTKLDWMRFIMDFVAEFGKELVDITHQFGKAAYVFYDDSWVGVEPWSEDFRKFGFDGLIKCVFSGYESRLCAGVKAVKTHELRLHPYLFPVGLGGAPTFKKGGNPTRDAKWYWKNIRRAVLREKIDRIGLGGYLSLTVDFPDFHDCIEEIANEFRMIKDFHETGSPYVFKPKIAVLTFWGKLRSWTCAGHYHEHPNLDLINVLEALSGMAFDVDFIDFDEVTKENLKNYDVIINAGTGGSAWSGGDAWKREEIVSNLTEWVYNGGTFLGINEPSAVDGYDTYFRMAHILGVDLDRGERECHGKFKFDIDNETQKMCSGIKIKEKNGLYLTDKSTLVAAADGDKPQVTFNRFGKGCGVYMSSFKYSDTNNRALQNIILCSCDENPNGKYITDNPCTECCFYPKVKKLVVINNSEQEQKTSVLTDNGKIECKLKPFETLVKEIN